MSEGRTLLYVIAVLWQAAGASAAVAGGGPHGRSTVDDAASPHPWLLQDPVPQQGTRVRPFDGAVLRSDGPPTIIIPTLPAALWGFVGAAPRALGTNDVQLDTNSDAELAFKFYQAWVAMLVIGLCICVGSLVNLEKLAIFIPLGLWCLLLWLTCILEWGVLRQPTDLSTLTSPLQFPNWDSPSERTPVWDCTPVDATGYVPAFMCEDFRDRSYANPGTVEHFFAVAMGTPFDLALGLVVGVLDIWLTTIIRSAYVVAYPIVAAFWKFVFAAGSAIVWLLWAFRAFASNSPYWIGAVWVFWYYTVFWSVVAASLTAPCCCCACFWAVIFYFLIWVSLGLVACVAVTIALLVLIPVFGAVIPPVSALIVIFFILVYLAFIVVFAALALAVFIFITFGGALVCFAFSAIALVLLIVIFLLMWAAGLLLFVLGWVVIFVVTSAVLLFIISLLYSVVWDPQHGPVQPLNNASSAAEGHSSRLSETCKVIKLVVVVGLSALFAVLMFWTDLCIVGSMVQSFGSIVDSGNSGGSADGADNDDGYRPPPTPMSRIIVTAMPFLRRSGIPALLGLVESIYFFGFSFSRNLRDRFSWKCHGAIALFPGTQLIMGLFTIFLLHVADLKAQLANLLVLSKPYPVCAVLADATVTLALKQIQLMLSGGSNAFLYMVRPLKKAPCTYEGDLIVAIGGYSFLWVTGPVALVMMPGVLLGRPSKEFESLRDIYDTWKGLFGLVFGYWNAQSVDESGLMDVELWTPDDTSKTRNTEFLRISARITAAGLNMLPGGTYAAQMMQSSHTGAVWHADDIDGMPPVYRWRDWHFALQVALKVCAWGAVLCLVIVPFCENAAQTAFIWIGSVCAFGQACFLALVDEPADKCGFDESNLKNPFFTFVSPVLQRLKGAGTSCQARSGTGFGACAQMWCWLCLACGRLVRVSARTCASRCTVVCRGLGASSQKGGSTCRACCGSLTHAFKRSRVVPAPPEGAGKGGSPGADTVGASKEEGKAGDKAAPRQSGLESASVVPP